MQRKFLHHLVCPDCKNKLILCSEQEGCLDDIISGSLICANCDVKYPVINSIPRFVSLENYSDSFGFEWLKHAKTQYDSYTHTNITKERFFNETLWDQHLAGQILLEVGSGSGRFTEIAATTGAVIVSVDYSIAVEANYASNGHKQNVLIVQADIYHLPFRENYFDKVLCIGVLQHTPDVESAFFTLPRYLKSGGKLVVDVYRKHKGFFYIFQTRYFVRPFVKEMSSEQLYRICTQYIEKMWKIATVIHKIPVIGSRINWILLIPDYRDTFPLSEELLKEWAILDTFDILSPMYDFPQYLETVERWFSQASLKDIEVKYGYNGIMGRGKK